jgi:hypothetical protein
MAAWASFRRISGSAALAVLAWTIPAAAAPGPPPDLVPGRSGARSQAIAALSAGGSATATCLTPYVQAARSERQHSTAAIRRALTALSNDPALPSERLGLDADGITARFTTDRNALDRIDVLDDNANGRPDAVDEALAGAASAQRLLVGQLELGSPGNVEIVLGRLGSNVDGVSIPVTGKPARTRVWLDPAARGGVSSVRRAAEHQYAHAVATTAGLDPAWGEAFATWATIAIEGAPDDRTLEALASRLATQREGLVTQDFDRASGNAAWFAFLNDSFGPTAVKLAVEELGRGGSDQAALDRAMRRATGDSFDAAFREYQVWSLLVGPRDDGKHFAFGSRLPAPVFAATEDALPALSIQADPEVGPMGQTAVLLTPDQRSGGVTVRFEGDPASRWSSDILLVGDAGELRRVSLPLDADASGDLTVPLQDAREVVLLVRNLDAEGRPARRYSWAAHFERGFPVEFGSAEVTPAAGSGGAIVSWETATEHRLLGFNVLRTRADRGEATRVNPVWIPSVGEAAGPAAYSFFDATAAPGVSYRYRIEAVTLEGLSSRSEPIALSPAP